MHLDAGLSLNQRGPLPQVFAGAFFLAMFVHALATGRFKGRGGVILRTEEPARFWRVVAIRGLVAIALLLRAVYKARTGG